MYIVSGEEMRSWDEYTIRHEPVSSVDLMERAGSSCYAWIRNQNWKEKMIHVFCGKGNNGGDGMVVARLLVTENYKVSVHVLESGKKGSTDFEINLQRLQDIHPAIHFIHSSDGFPVLNEEEVVIDALFGTGLGRPLEGLAAELVLHINSSGATTVSIDVPSGLFTDRSSKGSAVIQARYTFTFQALKTAFVIQENAGYIGDVVVSDIGLHPRFPQEHPFQYQMIDHGLSQRIFRPRNDFAHKGNYGHALLVCGSFGKVGAAVLATKACVHGGAGLTTTVVPNCGYLILQICIPEAMTLADEKEYYISTLPEDIDRYTAVGIGPGIGTKEETRKTLSFIIRRYSKPLVVDADGLNCLSLQPDLLQLLPSHSILTPHPKEFDRLFGGHKNDFERMSKAAKKAKELNIIIILKGHHTLVAASAGELFFNSTGNAGMAKGGSGDVLTGIITALLAQGYQPADAAKLGVYLHGSAGDRAARALSKESMTASDLIDFMADAFSAFYSR